MGITKNSHNALFESRPHQDIDAFEGMLQNIIGFVEVLDLTIFIEKPITNSPEFTRND